MVFHGLLPDKDIPLVLYHEFMNRLYLEVFSSVCACVGLFIYSTSTIAGQQSIIMSSPGTSSVPSPAQHVAERLRHFVSVNLIPWSSFLLFTEAPKTPL